MLEPDTHHFKTNIYQKDGGEESFLLGLIIPNLFGSMRFSEW